MENKNAHFHFLKDYHYAPEAAVGGNRVQTLCDGPQVFKAILESIKGARHQIALEFYTFASDQTGQRVLQALVARAKKGVKVRLIYDGIGSLWTDPSFFTPLRQASGEVQVFHPPYPWNSGWSWKKRDHRKLLIVDDAYVLIGGLNISDHYSLSPEKGGFHDLALSIEGPVSQQAWKIFERSWNRSVWPLALRLDAGIESTVLKNNGDTFVEIVGNDHLRDRWNIRRRMIYAISKARSSVYIINPYFLPDLGLTRALKKAVERGVSVQILIPNKSDTPIVDLASIVTQRKLLKRGVKVYRWPGMLHAKVVLVDSVWFSIGSYNFDHLSLFENLEIVANAIDPGSGNTLSMIIEKDLHAAKEMFLEDLRSLPWWKRILSRFFYSLRRFL